MKPIEVRDALRAEGKHDMADQVQRMMYALKIAANNLWGSGFDSLKPISVQFGQQIAELCDAAVDGTEHQKLDDAIAKAEA